MGLGSSRRHVALWGSGIARPWVSPERHTRSWRLAAGGQQCPELRASRLLKRWLGWAGRSPQRGPGQGPAGLPRRWDGCRRGNTAPTPACRPAALGGAEGSCICGQHKEPRPLSAPRCPLHGQTPGCLRAPGTRGAPTPCPCSCSGWVPKLWDLSLPGSTLLSPGRPRWGRWSGTAGRVPGLRPGMNGRCLCLGPSLG